MPVGGGLAVVFPNSFTKALKPRKNPAKSGDICGTFHRNSLRSWGVIYYAKILVVFYLKNFATSVSAIVFAKSLAETSW